MAQDRLQQRLFGLQIRGDAADVLQFLQHIQQAQAGLGQAEAGPVIRIGRPGPRRAREACMGRSLPAAPARGQRQRGSRARDRGWDHSASEPLTDTPSARRGGAEPTQTDIRE